MLSLLSYIWLPVLAAIIIGITLYSLNSDSRFAKILRIIFFSSVVIFVFIVLGYKGHEIWMGQ